jgi:lipopolysaccharide biosynthesis glycosyltransferase
VAVRPRHFAFAGDGDYSIQLATAVSGLLSTLRGDPRPVELWILDVGLAADARARVESVVAARSGVDVTLHWVPVPASALAGLEPEGHFTSATYGRLLLPTLLPDDVVNVVCLDSDLVVLGDVSPLTDLPLGETPAAAVQDFVVETVGSERSAISGLSSRAPEDPYFNAGVLVINAPVWRQLALSERVFDFARRHAPLPYADQDALNAVLEDWRELPVEWNVQSRIFWLDRAAETELVRRLRASREAILRRAIVIHFSGPSKPWEPWDRNPSPRLWRRAMIRSGALSRAELRRWAVRYYPRRLLARTLLSLRRGFVRKVAQFRSGN